jgi:protein SCO1/2
MMKRFFKMGAVACMALLMSAASVAQVQGEKKTHTFHGKVEKVSSDGLTVNGDKVEGWMDAMTMKYKVDDKNVLKTVKPGDEITATVYDGDLSLHKVQVVSKPAK